MNAIRHRYPFTLRLHDVDGAGRIFFGHLFRHFNDASEAFLAAAGHPLSELLAGGEILLPVVHAEADFRRPLRHGESLTIEVEVAQVGERSFTLGYRVVDDEEGLRAEGQTVHVCVDAASGESRRLPDWLREVLAP